METIEKRRKAPRRGSPKLPGLVDARGRALLTQQQLSERSGVPQQTISQLEQQNRGARIVTIHRLARALGVEPGELTGEGEEVNET